ncbi:hypothetical protein CA833_03350 [Novosphingobium sp. KA1]|nr:hypothetical protein CA833_03350 [Novosphingobium sp. KA1]
MSSQGIRQVRKPNWTLPHIFINRAHRGCPVPKIRLRSWRHPKVHSSPKSLGLAVLLAGTFMSGCTSTTHNPNLPRGAAAYEVIPPTVSQPSTYSIVPADTLQVRVVGEPDLSVEKALVDDAGFIHVPVAGEIKAAGRSAPEVANDITERLRRKYMRDPQVAVSVDELALRYVSVEGEVNKPGVYELSKNATLLSAIARAESPLVTAKLDEVVIFRTINGQRMAARFNLKDIRTGVAPDPVILDGDVVMIGNSVIKGLWQDFLKAAPVFNAFAVISRN